MPRLLRSATSDLSGSDMGRGQHRNPNLLEQPFLVCELAREGVSRWQWEGRASRPSDEAEAPAAPPRSFMEVCTSRFVYRHLGKFLIKIGIRAEGSWSPGYVPWNHAWRRKPNDCGGN